MNRFSRTMSLALLACMSLVGCGTPASASVVNLDKPTFDTSPLNNGDTLTVTRYNAYTFDNVKGQPFKVASDDSKIVSVSVDSFDQVNLSANSPGKTKIRTNIGGTMRTYTVVVQ